MKKILLTTVVALAVNSAMAQEPIDSTVIHNYKQVGVGYGYLHDLDNTDINAHGVLAGASYDIQNVLFSVSGGYFFGDDDLGIDADIETWQVSGDIGYIIRAMENRINVIPSVGMSYSEAEIDSRFGSAESDVTLFTPGVMLSYAINNSFSVGAGYAYAMDVDDTDNDGHALVVGGKVKLAEHVGLGVSAEFVEDYGFSSLSAILSYHF